MKKLTETKLLDLMRELSTETEPRFKQIYDKLQEAMACESNVVNIGKVDLYSLASNDKLRPALQGVFHQEGNRIVSDSVILAVIKSEYPSELEGKIIAKDGSVIEERYPNYKSVIPADISNDQWLSYPIDYARVLQLEKDFRVYKKVNGKKAAEEYDMKFGKSYMRVGYFLQFCKLLKEYDIDCVKISDARKMMIVKADSLTALLMLCHEKSGYENLVDWSDVEPCEDTDNQFEDFEL